MANYQYRFFNVLNNQYLGDLEIYGVTFNRPVRGTGSFSGTVNIDDENAEFVRACLNFNFAMLVIFRDGIPYWAGFPTKRSWNSASSNVQFDAAKARHLLNTNFLRPQRSIDGAGKVIITDVVYSWTQIEQQRIAREICNFAMEGIGHPRIFTSEDTSPIIQDYNTLGTAFKYAGEIIDIISSRAEGFDWDVEVRNATLGDGVELYLATWYPERGTGVSNVFFEFDPNGDGNIIDYGSVDESADQRATRVWATGEGTPPSQPISLDEDPQLYVTAQLLASEKLSNYSSVVYLDTLSSHARAERAALSVPIDLLSLRIDPDMLQYFEPGDRCRVKVKDRWLDIDLPDARIVDVSIAPFDRSQGEAVGVTIDLSDLTIPSEQQEETE